MIEKVISNFLKYAPEKVQKMEERSSRYALSMVYLYIEYMISLTKVRSKPSCLCELLPMPNFYSRQMPLPVDPLPLEEDSEHSVDTNASEEY